MQSVSNQMFDRLWFMKKTVYKHLYLIEEALIISGLLHDFCYICII